jgi:NmrA-like family
MTQKLTVVVTGATGKQGGAVARGLLKQGHKMRAVTRDPNSSRAKSLADAGATLVAASLEDTAGITKALEGATSLFAMTTPFGGTDAEIRQGCRGGRRSQGRWGASRLHVRRLRQPPDGRSALRQQIRGRKTHCQSRRPRDDSRARCLHGKPLFHKRAARDSD